MNKISSHEYCRNFARHQDYNLYLLHFFMPHIVRRDALALIALHCELKTIQQKAVDPTMIMIRLKWWYDHVIALTQGTQKTESPVLEELYVTFQTHGISNKEVETYFKAFETWYRGEPADIDGALYTLLGRIISENKARDRFSCLLQYHDKMKEHAAFRALRLWLKSLAFHFN